LQEFIRLPRRDFYISQGLLVDDPQRLQATLNGRLLLGTLTAELLN
jgi:hypothetical protein